MDFGRLLVYLSIGTIAMLVPIMMQGAWYRVNWYKRILIAVLLAFAGTLGTFMLYYIENGQFGGTSFFGAVFFVPILFFPVSKMLRISYNLLMDLCAPAECAMLAIMKVQCYLTDCCGGRRFLLDGKEFVFPSQLTELANALILGVVLLLISRKNKNQGKLFPWYMILYGVTRFVLNLLRDVADMAYLPLPLGNFWSLVSIAIGGVWLIWARRRTGKEERQ